MIIVHLIYELSYITFIILAYLSYVQLKKVYFNELQSSQQLPLLFIAHSKSVFRILFSKDDKLRESLTSASSFDQKDGPKCLMECFP